MKPTTMNHMICTLTIPFLFAAAGVYAQTESAQPKSVEDLYLESSVSVETLAFQMLSPERDVQLLALSTLEHQLNSGLIALDDNNVLVAVQPIVDQGVLNISRHSDRTIQGYDPVVRREAVRLVGRFDTAEARRMLITTVTSDPEPTVRAAALFGLARTGYDPTGEVSRAVARMMMREHVQSFDEGVMYAAVAALGAVVNNPESDTDPAAREMLINVISDYRYPKMIRDLAHKALSSY